MNEHLLLVEDDAELSEVLAMILARAGLRVTSERDGRQALIRFQQESYDVVVLDLMLPSLDGYEVCREIRRSSMVPIVMLTAKNDTADVVAGLELGADDYITKPFEAPELVARIRAALRRSSGKSEERARVIGDLEIDPAAFTLLKGGKPVSLSATEFRLLLELSSQPGRVLTREVLLQRVWNYDYLGDSRLVDMAVKRLRDKIEDDPGRPEFVKTVRGVGYRFDGVGPAE